MTNDLLILVAEDDDGHFTLIERNLIRVGDFTSDQIVRFKDGQAVLDFLENSKSSASAHSGRPLLLLLDIRMPKVDGVEVLSRVKADNILRKMPVIVLTTTADPKVVDTCRRLGCSMYVNKPVEYEKFIESIQEIGRFLSNLEITPLSGS